MRRRYRLDGIPSQADLHELIHQTRIHEVSSKTNVEALVGQPPYVDGASHRETGDSFDRLKRLEPRREGMATAQPTLPGLMDALIHDLNLRSEDVVFDLGSGTGQAALLFAMLSDVRQVIGIELEPVYRAFAARRAKQLGLNHVRFVWGDATTADLSEGTVFFAFNPFRPNSDEGRAVVRRMAQNLRGVGRKKSIRVVTTGALEEPLDLAVEKGLFSVRRLRDVSGPRVEPWLAAYSIYQS